MASNGENRNWDIGGIKRMTWKGVAKERNRNFGRLVESYDLEERGEGKKSKFWERDGIEWTGRAWRRREIEILGEIGGIKRMTWKGVAQERN
jgi:hypothetical protein